MDRDLQCPVLLYSKFGGMHYQEILSEEVNDMQRLRIDWRKNINIHEMIDVAKYFEIDD